MTGFVTIMVLICQVHSYNNLHGHPSDLYCYDKGIANLRGPDVQTYSKFEYYKCQDKSEKNCNTEIRWDGCKYILKDKDVFYSSDTCQ